MVRGEATLYRIRNKKGESLEDFDHVLDMVGHGWAWSRMLSAKTEVKSKSWPAGDCNSER